MFLVEYIQNDVIWFSDDIEYSASKIYIQFPLFVYENFIDRNLTNIQEFQNMLNQTHNNPNIPIFHKHFVLCCIFHNVNAETNYQCSKNCQTQTILSKTIIQIMIRSFGKCKIDKALRVKICEKCSNPLAFSSKHLNISTK